MSEEKKDLKQFRFANGTKLHNGPLVYSSNTSEKILTLEKERDLLKDQIYESYAPRIHEIDNLLLTEFTPKHPLSGYKLSLTEERENLISYYNNELQEIEENYRKMIYAVIESSKKKGGKSTKRTRKHKSKRRHSRRK